MEYSPKYTMCNPLGYFSRGYEVSACLVRTLGIRMTGDGESKSNNNNNNNNNSTDNF